MNKYLQELSWKLNIKRRQNPSEIWELTQALCNGKQFLLHY